MPAAEMVTQLVQPREGLVVTQPTREARPDLGIDVARQAVGSGEPRSTDAGERGVPGVQGMLFKIRFLGRYEKAFGADVVEEVQPAVRGGGGNDRAWLAKMLLVKGPAMTHAVRQGVNCGIGKGNLKYGRGVQGQ